MTSFEGERRTRTDHAGRVDEPLSGRRILILKAEHQSNRAATLLEEEGASTEVIPAVRVEIPSDMSTIDDAWHRAGSFDWIVFMSAKAVDTFLGRMRALQVEAQPLARNIAAVGPATARALDACGVPHTWMPSKFTPSGLAAELPEDRGRKVLLVRSDKTTDAVDKTLVSHGFEIERLNAYTTTPLDPDGLQRAVKSGPDVIVVTSPSSARALAAAVSEKSSLRPVCTISPATSEACMDGGIPVAVEAAAHTSEGLVKALLDYFGG